MRPEEFTNFKESKPNKNKWIIVTNNIEAKNTHGEMSHLWLTNFYTESKYGKGILSYSIKDAEIINLTHWKYA